MLAFDCPTNSPIAPTFAGAALFRGHLVSIALSLLAGCGAADGPQRAPVAGSVWVDGAPLEEGIVRFIPQGASAGPAAVATIKAGRFELNGSSAPVVGTHRIEIEALNFQGFELDDEKAFADRAGSGRKLPTSPIPPPYNRDSKKTVTLPASGNQQLEFQIDTKTRSKTRKP
ncbi:MAG: hypothetical protein ACT4QC_13575 [Planctomycetaceae bacterium]